MVLLLYEHFDYGVYNIEGFSCDLADIFIALEILEYLNWAAREASQNV